MTVTKSDGRIIYELAGRPALERLVELLESLDADDRALAQRGIHLGRVIDEHKIDFDRGDFLIRTVLGGDRDVGAIAVGDDVEVGATVQFQVRDAESADHDLRELLTGQRREGGARLHVQRQGHALVRHVPITTHKSSTPMSMAAPPAGCSVQANSARSATAASSTASPRRSCSLVTDVLLAT